MSSFLLQDFQQPVLLTFHSYLLPTFTCPEPLVLLTAAMPMRHLLSITCMRPQELTEENSLLHILCRAREDLACSVGQWKSFLFKPTLCSITDVFLTQRNLFIFCS